MQDAINGDYAEWKILFFAAFLIGDPAQNCSQPEPIDKQSCQFHTSKITGSQADRTL
jgi:hypothetical protein